MGKSAVLREMAKTPLVLLTTDTPERGSVAYEALKRVTGINKPVRAVIEILKVSGLEHCSFVCRRRRGTEAADYEARAWPQRSVPATKTAAISTDSAAMNAMLAAR